MAAEPVDGTAEEIPAEHPSRSEALAVTPRTGGSTALISAAGPTEMITIATEMATALDSVIKAQGMRTKVGRAKKVSADGREEWVDKYHVNVEAWQTLGTFLGLAVVPHVPQPILNDDGTVALADYEVVRERYPKGTTGQAIRSGQAVPDSVERALITGPLGFTARVEVFKDGVLIAAGNSRCDRNEETWRDRDAYALEGMAQTRATGRSIAGAARWIVALAGYSGTPAEEMPANADEHHAPAMPAWTFPASDELTQVVRGAIGYLLGDDPQARGGHVDEVMGKLTADTDGTLTAAVARAVAMTASKVKRLAEAAPNAPADPPTPETEDGTPVEATVVEGDEANPRLGEL